MLHLYKMTKAEIFCNELCFSIFVTGAALSRTMYSKVLLDIGTFQKFRICIFWKALIANIRFNSPYVVLLADFKENTRLYGQESGNGVEFRFFRIFQKFCRDQNITKSSFVKALWLFFKQLSLREANKIGLPRSYSFFNLAMLQ